MILRHRIAFLLTALTGAALDLLSKHYAFLYIPHEGREVDVIPGFFAFNRLTNPGIVFGWGPEYSRVFLYISILAVPIILFLYFRIPRPHWVVTAALGLVLAGTIGNLYDRVQIGEVRDFLKFYVVTPTGEHAWPSFNIADSCICVGVALLFVEMMFFDEKKPVPAPVEVPAAGVSESGATEPTPTIGEETAHIPPENEHAPPPPSPGP